MALPSARKKIQPLSPYITPYFDRWTQAHATDKQIVQEFREMLAIDFNRLDAEELESSAHFFERKDYGFTYVPQAYYRQKENKFVYAAVFEVTHTAASSSPYVPRHEVYYRLYDFSYNIEHPEYHIVKHMNPGEMLSHPVPNLAPHIAVAENGLIMMRPTEGIEDQILYMRNAPVLKL